MSEQPTRSLQGTPLAELLAADKATRAAAAAVDQWLDLYRRAAGETLSEPHLDLLLREALEAIARMLNADAVSLLLANEEGSELVSRAAFGLDREVELSISIPNGAGLSGPILATGEPRLVEDLTRINVLSQLLRSSGQRSYVGVPLSSGGRTFGVLHATRRQVSSFDQNDVELLRRFAEPIAAAIERVRLFEAERSARQLAERATERIRGLQRITAALVAAVTVTEVCEMIIREAVQGAIGDGERAIWMLRDSRLWLVAGFGASAEYPEIPLDPSLPAGEILREGVPLFVESRAELSRRWPALADGPTSSFAALPLLVEDRRLGVMAVGFRDEHHFAPDEREYLILVAEQAAIALARAESLEALQEARSIAESRREQLAFLAAASARLSGSLDLDVTLETVAELGVPRLTDRCALFLREDGKISKRVLAPELSGDEWRLFEETELSLSSPNGVGAVIRTGRAQYVKDMDDSMLAARSRSPAHLELLRKVGFGGALILPLRTRGRALGALAFVNRKGRAMDEETRALAEELAGRAATAIDNATSYAFESHVAHRLAQSLLPARLPTIKGLDLAVRYQAGSTGIDVGGDFYDVFEIGNEDYVVVIGDVQGKGVEAAAVTGLARHTVRASARSDTSPAGLLQRLNEAIVQNIVESGASIDRPGTSARLCTAAIIRLDRRGQAWSATVSCAGHPSPLLRRTDGKVESICGSGLLLGVRREVHYDETVIDLVPGSVLVMYTDGVTERHSDDHMFGSEGIAEVLRNIRDSASRITDDILEAALNHASRHEDDLVVLTIRVDQATSAQSDES